MFPQGILGIEGGGPAAITGRSGKFSLSSEIQLFFALRGFEQKMRLARDTARKAIGPSRVHIAALGSGPGSVRRALEQAGHDPIDLVRPVPPAAALPLVHSLYFLTGGRALITRRAAA